MSEPLFYIVCRRKFEVAHICVMSLATGIPSDHVGEYWAISALFKWCFRKNGRYAGQALVFFVEHRELF